eukprot:GHVO01055289.1.p1 GENE.GHVO01055289.1~~GHVO01055289.1.p1  ORF type:complete len:314 (-),score=37.71 GHVO01055289.1:96-1037(-)
MDPTAFTISTMDAVKKMASDPFKSSAIVNDDACLGGLVMVLSNKDLNIVKAALETLQSLAERLENRIHMKNFLGMMEQLELLSYQWASSLNMIVIVILILYRACPMVKPLAEKLYLSLKQSAPIEKKPAQHQDVLKECRNQQQTEPVITKEAKSTRKVRRNSFFLGGVSKCKTITLLIRGMDHRDDVELCRNSLLTVPGVISITFDSKARRAILRTKPSLQPELLAQAISRTMTMYAEQIVRDEDGNEAHVSFGKQGRDYNKENENMPDYPSDTDSPVKGRDNMAPMGGPQPHGDKWGLFKSMGSFLSNSFYW